MGKKTLEEIGKILLVSMISILISVTATRRVLIDKKLDKAEYYRDQSKHEKLHESDKKDLKHITDRVDAIYEHLIKEK